MLSVTPAPRAISPACDVVNSPIFAERLKYRDRRAGPLGRRGILPVVEHTLHPVAEILVDGRGVGRRGCRDRRLIVAVGVAVSTPRVVDEFV